MCDCVLLLLPHLERERVTGPVCVQARCHKVPQGEDAIVCCHIPSPEGKDGSCKHTKPVECLGWAVEPLLDVLLCAAVKKTSP